jgi:hypothetical protein
MTKQQIRGTLSRIYMSLPHDFNLREVKFYVYQAIQKLDHVERKQKRHEIKEPIASFTKQPVVPFAKQPVTTSFKLEDHLIKEKIDLIDKMIEGEENKIAEIANKKGKINGPTDNIQTYLG